MALAVCKACQKSICLMCVHEEKDGTFCSEACVGNFREVSDWVGGGSSAPPEGAQPQPAVTAVEAPPASVFEEMPDRAPEVAHPDPVAIPSSEPEEPPAETPPAPSTSNIGNPCYAHPDIRAKAFCRRCKKPICGLCIIENAAGMFCSDACVASGRSRKVGAGAKAGIVVAILVAAAVGLYAFKPDLVKGLLGVTPPRPPKPPRTEHATTPPKPIPPKPPPEDPKPEPPKPEPPKPEPPKPEPPKPEPPKPVPPPLPPPPKPEPPKPTILVHPWSDDEPGAWYRVRRQGRLEDLGLKARDALSYVLVTQAWNGSTAGAAAEKKVEIDPVELLGEEPVEIEGRTYLCEVRLIKTPAGARREWTLASTRHAGAVLRAETPEGLSEAVRVWEHTITLGERSFDCLVVESRAAGGKFVKTWYCPSYPLKKVRVERDGVLEEELVDCGYDWADRPAPKP